MTSYGKTYRILTENDAYSLLNNVDEYLFIRLADIQTKIESCFENSEGLKFDVINPRDVFEYNLLVTSREQVGSILEEYFER